MTKTIDKILNKVNFGKVQNLDMTKVTDDNSTENCYKCLNLYDKSAVRFSIAYTNMDGLTGTTEVYAYLANSDTYGNPQLLINFVNFDTAKTDVLYKKMLKIGKKVPNENLMFYVQSYNNFDTLIKVYKATREALGYYKYIATGEGLGIVSIDYGIDDRVQFRDLNNPQKLHSVKLNYNGNTNFKYNGHRYYLDTFIRTNI